MSDKPFKMPGFPKHSGVNPGSSPNKILPALIVAGVDAGLSAVESQATPGGYLDHIMSKGRGGPVMSWGRKQLDKIDRLTKGGFSRSIPSWMKSLAGYKHGAYSPEGRRVMQMKKKVHQYQRYQHAMLEKKKLADKHLKRTKKNA